MKKDDLIAEAINLGLGKEQDLTSYSKSELIKLIESKEPKKEEVVKTSPQKHKFYRG